MMIRSVEKEKEKEEEKEAAAAKEAGRQASRQSLDRNPFHKNRTIAKISWPPTEGRTGRERGAGDGMGWMTKSEKQKNGHKPRADQIADLRGNGRIGG